MCCIIHTSFCLSKVFLVLLVIIEVACEPTSFLSLMFIMLSSFNYFYAFVLFQQPGYNPMHLYLFATELFHNNAAGCTKGIIFNYQCVI